MVFFPFCRVFFFFIDGTFKSTALLLYWSPIYIFLLLLLLALLLSLVLTLELAFILSCLLYICKVMTQIPSFPYKCPVVSGPFDGDCSFLIELS